MLAWSQQHDVELGLKLCASIWRFWEMHSLIGEGRAWLETLIARWPSPTAARGRALAAAAALAVYQADFQTARAHTEEALSIFRQMEEGPRIARAPNELGLIASYQGAYAAAQRFLEQSLAIRRQSGDEWSIANSVMNLGLFAGYRNDHAVAYRLHQESLAIYRALVEKSGIAMHLGRLEESRAYQAESLQPFNELGDKDGLTECLERFALLANAQADFRRAALLFGAASALREEAGKLLPLADQAEYDRELKVTRARIDRATFDAAWAEGLGMALERAIATAINQPSR